MAHSLQQEDWLKYTGVQLVASDLFGCGWAKKAGVPPLKRGCSTPKPMERTVTAECTLLSKCDYPLKWADGKPGGFLMLLNQTRNAENLADEAFLKIETVRGQAGRWVLMYVSDASEPRIDSWGTDPKSDLLVVRITPKTLAEKASVLYSQSPKTGPNGVRQPWTLAKVQTSLAWTGGEYGAKLFWAHLLPPPTPTQPAKQQKPCCLGAGVDALIKELKLRGCASCPPAKKTPPQKKRRVNKEEEEDGEESGETCSSSSS